MEDRFKPLENRKRQRPTEDQDDYPGSSNSIERQETEHPSALGHHSVVHPSIELRDSKSSSSDTIPHRYKRQRYTKGIKVTPSYTLKVSLSLREWGDQKRDIKRVFKGDPNTY